MAGLDDRRDRYGPFDQPGDRAIAKLAADQHGVVGTWQLKGLGYGKRAIRRRVEAARLHRLYRGVYAVGHDRLTRKGRWMAAVLACGPRAVLSHRAAVALWDLRPPAAGPIDVTVPGRTRRGQTGIRVHNVRGLHPDDRMRLDGIPVTSVHRSLLDYAEVARQQQLRLALEAADRRELLDGRKLDELMSRSRGRRGIRPLRETVSQLTGPAPWTLSELENRFLAFVRELKLPEPRTNVLVAGLLVDCYWPAERLVVELDGYAYHKARRNFEEDRRRDIRLTLAGVRTARITQRRLQDDPSGLEYELRSLLGGPPPAADASGP